MKDHEYPITPQLELIMKFKDQLENQCAVKDSMTDTFLLKKTNKVKVVPIEAASLCKMFFRNYQIYSKRGWRLTSQGSTLLSSEYESYTLDISCDETKIGIHRTELAIEKNATGPYLLSHSGKKNNRIYFTFKTFMRKDIFMLKMCGGNLDHWMSM